MEQSKIKNMESTGRLSYNKLWKLLIDKEMSKKDLSEKSGVCSTTLAKLKRNENVNTSVLLKICLALECDVSDIVEVIR